VDTGNRRQRIGSARYGPLTKGEKMKTSTLLPLFFGALVALACIAAAARMKGWQRRNAEKPRARQPVTKNEQPMYFRLVEAFPEHVVLAQVSFSALLTARTTATRNTFDRKTADFVLCTKAFEVLAVIELDDASHKGREANDRKRDRLLTDAGYRVLRYKTTPDREVIRAAITAITAPTTDKQSMPPLAPMAK
jgi:very-short-patch-repair endonuclease